MKTPKSDLVEEKRPNPQLSNLDRLAEIMPPRRMVPWPYLIAIWSAE